MKQLKIACHVNEVNYRGLFKAAVDYIRYNKAMFGHEGIIVAPDARATMVQHHPLGKEMVKAHPSNEKYGLPNFDIKLIQYPSGSAHNNEPLHFHPHVDNLIKQEKCDLLYIVKAGDTPDRRVSKIVPTLSHGWKGVPWESGDWYTKIMNPKTDKSIPTTPELATQCRSAAMSKLAGIRGQSNDAVVPTIVEPNKVESNLRTELGIPKYAKVFGNLGGAMVFNLGQTKRIIEKIVQTRGDMYFIFMGIEPLGWSFRHKQIIYVKPTADYERRYAFINSCQAMIHARKQGEMGGGAVAEFSVSNKPVITSNTGKSGARSMLKEKAFVYATDQDLWNILMNWDTKKISETNWDCYSNERFPEPAMEKFNELFLKDFT